ncbi:hypothetical protein QR680_007802 [Steinernema hermaphroditum]|uniref:Fork-head domain-containing protein n=1 Tax=Steinernema hermaphroditum TaxID=289476 RepID=A0AA39IEA2_9BILA|nr:hypothetical protein QR680_007802 [Steinernema hermaphroditum]
MEDDPPSRQNQYGLSYPAMIIVAIRNSDCAVPNDFCNRALNVRDIYTFLKAHVAPFQQMSEPEWNQAERRIRFDDQGRSEIIPSKAAADKGCMWTIHPFQNESSTDTLAKIRKTLKEERVRRFRNFLVNGDLLEQIVDGRWGWRDPYGNPLRPSEAAARLSRNVVPASRAPSYASMPPSPIVSSRQRLQSAYRAQPSELPSLATQYPSVPYNPYQQAVYLPPQMFFYQPQQVYYEEDDDEGFEDGENYYE